VKRVEVFETREASQFCGTIMQCGLQQLDIIQHLGCSRTIITDLDWLRHLPCRPRITELGKQAGAKNHLRIRDKLLGLNLPTPCKLRMSGSNKLARPAEQYVDLERVKKGLLGGGLEWGRNSPYEPNRVSLCAQAASQALKN
jgi:hypothetical protein